MMNSALRARRGNAWLTPFLAAVLALATVLVVAGCGSGTAHDPPSRRAGPASLEGAAVYSFLAASGAQLAQGNAFYLHEAQIINLGTARCMQALGFGGAKETFARYDEKYFNPPQGSPVAPGFAGMDSSGVPALFDMAVLGRKGSMLMPVAIGAPPRPYTLPYATRVTINTDFLRCQRQAGQPFAPLNSEGNALNALWLRDVSAVQGTRAVRAANARFAACLRGKGVPASASSSLPLFGRWLALLVRPAAYPYGHPALIRSLVALDRRWTGVFVTCAGSLESMMQHLQMAAQKAFFLAHRQQIQALERAAGRGTRG